MVSITQNRPRYCKATAGGIKSLFVAPWRKVSRSEYQYDGASLTEFPETFIYRFELTGPTEFVQDMQQDDGGKYYDVGLTAVFNKITVFDNLNFQKMLRKDYFLIVEDNNGNFFLLGFRNGVSADSLTTSTTQYTIEFSGMEEEAAPFVTDLIGTNFLIEERRNYIFQDGDNYIFQDDYNYIFQ